MEDDFSPWTPLTAARLRAAGERLTAAVSAHAEAVASARSDADFAAVLAASERLLPSVLEYADAQFEHTGNAFPFGVLHQFAGDDEGGDDLAGDAPPPPGVSVLQRHDYEVRDEAAVIAAGRAAYRSTQPDEDEAAADADVDSLGRALYQVAHADGWHALRETDGLRPTGGSVVVTATDETLGADPDQWPDELFDGADGDLLYRQDDVFPG